MESFISFLSSGLFANILSILGIILAILPQKDTVSIDNSTTYYFESRNNSSSIDQIAGILALIGILITYITYAFFQTYYSIILLLLAILVIMKYRILKIAYIKQMMRPALLVIVCASLNHFLPPEVTNYWHHAYKIDIQQSGTLSKLFDQLINPVHEIINLVTTINTSPLSIAILATILFVATATFSMLQDLFRPRKNIKVTKFSDIIATIIFLAIIVSFMFYTNKNSPSRIFTEHVIYFLTN